ncbi:hypothetical protein RB195_007070 [Necator americanus]|uniref:Uncharacterized protein n=1 Tax=Necator americanus TaxID=51031 RepID=A0ABR1BX73_NECAM
MASMILLKRGSDNEARLFAQFDQTATDLSGCGLWRCAGRQHLLAKNGNLSPYNSASHIARSKQTRIRGPKAEDI